MQSKFLLISFFLVLFNQNLKSQGINSIWTLGYNCGIPDPHCGGITINFNSGAPQVLNTPRSMSFRRTCATIADTLGNLLFYTNGFAVCNLLGDTMPNGDSLDYNNDIQSWYGDGMPTPQGALILPFPGSNHLYYLFHEAWNLFTANNGQLILAPLHLFYSIIDMNADTGRGDVILKEQTIINDTLTTGRTTAVKHGNGRDWWIIKYEPYGNGYFSLLLTPNGLKGPYYQQIGPNLLYNSLGQAVFNPSGDKYANLDGINHLLLMDFDRCTGLFSNPINIPILDSGIARGVAFAPGGRYLYVSSDTILYQFDTWAANIGSTKDTIATWDGFYSPSFPFATTFYTMQLGPDGKIYITPGNGTDRLHVINNPDSAGLACDVCQHCIVLPTYNAFGCIPNHPNYFLGAETGSICDSLSIGIYDLQSPSSINIYPNPVSDFFWIMYDISHASENGTLVIYNTLGEMVLQKTIYNSFKTTKVECNNLQQGIYFLEIIQSSKKAGSGKIVKL